MASSEQIKHYFENPDAASEKFNCPWYSKSIDKYLTPKTQDFISGYCKIPKDRQSEHVHSIRDKAFALRPYPCTGLGVWLIPYISHSPAYTDIIKRLQAGGTLIDIGCFLGTDLRQLVFDGVPSDNLYGVDIVSHWELGFEMYRDNETFKAHFIKGDIMDAENNSQLKPLMGSIDIISISAVMHQWPYDMQVECATKLVTFSKPGSIVIGHQIGNVEAQQSPFGPKKILTYRHNAESMIEMWNEVGRLTDTKWKAQARMMDFADIDWDPKDNEWIGEGVKVVDFVVSRIE